MIDPNDVGPDDWEGVAREVLEGCAVSPPIDARVLAKRCGLDLVPWAKNIGLLRGATIRYPAGARHVRQHGVIAHEVGHWALMRAGIDSEDGARYMAGALMLPQRAFYRDLGRLDWDLFRILDAHPNVSAQMAATRMCQVSPATVAIWDQGALTTDLGRGARDRELVERVLATEQPIRGEVDAWPMLDGGNRRVVVIGRAA